MVSALAPQMISVMVLGPMEPTTGAPLRLPADSRRWSASRSALLSMPMPESSERYSTNCRRSAP